MQCDLTGNNKVCCWPRRQLFKYFVSSSGEIICAAFCEALKGTCVSVCYQCKAIKSQHLVIRPVCALHCGECLKVGNLWRRVETFISGPYQEHPIAKQTGG